MNIFSLSQNHGTQAMPITASEEPVTNAASPEFEASDILHLPITNDHPIILNDIVLTNLPNMAPNDLIVFSGSQIAPLGVSITGNNLKILGTVAVTNAVSFVDVPITEVIEDQVAEEEPAANGAVNSRIVLPVTFE